MLRSAGILLIGSCAVYLSVRTLRECEVRMGLYGSMVLFIRYIKERIVCFRQPLPEIYADFSDAVLDEYSFISLLSVSGWKNALEASGLSSMLDGDSVKALEELGAVLGKSGAREQEDACNICISRLTQNFEKVGSELPKKSRMKSSLCVIGAVAVIILVM